MNPAIDTMCTEALARLVKQINRSAGQHARAIKRDFAAAAGKHAAGDSTQAPAPTSATAFPPRPERDFP